VPTVPSSATLGDECHVRAALCQLHACNMLLCFRFRKVVGAPRRESRHGEGVGAISADRKYASSSCSPAALEANQRLRGRRRSTLIGPPRFRLMTCRPLQTHEKMPSELLSGTLLEVSKDTKCSYLVLMA
jgi:hypothetical protein